MQEVKDKIHPRAVSKPPFEKAPRGRRVLDSEEISFRVDRSSAKLSRCFRKVLASVYDVISEFAEASSGENQVAKKLMWSSIAAAFAHGMLQGWIAEEHRGKNVNFMMDGLFYCICVFFVFDCFFIYPCCCFKDHTNVRLMLYFVSLLFYLVFSCVVADYLREHHIFFCIGSSIIFALSASLLGVVVLFYFFIWLMYVPAYWTGRLVVYLRLKCCYREDKHERHSLYYYDAKNTIVTSCTICFDDFKKQDLVRLCKTHISHIFHEKCISEWVARKATCPLCNLPANFH